MARMSSEGTGTILAVLSVAAVATIGIVLYGRNAAAASKKPGASPGPRLEPLGFLPDLKVGDTVVVDTAEANIPADRGGAIPLLVCRVDMILSDPTLVSVAAVGATFKGTITRTAIKRVLAIDPGNLQT